MKDVNPRRFEMAVPPSSTRWVEETLRRVFPHDDCLPHPWNGLIAQLDRAG